MARRRKSKKRGPVRAKAIDYDGISFKSGLERYTYMKLKEHKLFEGYENEKFVLLESFQPANSLTQRQANSKGDFIERGGKAIRGITYTPDFCGQDFIIECKGRPNESFPLRWKLFLNVLHNTEDLRYVYKPQNQKEVDKMITLMLSAAGFDS